MVKTYYRSEYSDKQWKALIDKAAELGCQVTYGRYGDRVEIDSTERIPCSRAPTRVLTTAQLEASGRSISTRCCRRAQTLEGGKYSPRDTAKAIARLSARARSQQSTSRSASREQQVLNG